MAYDVFPKYLSDDSNVGNPEADLNTSCFNISVHEPCSLRTHCGFVPLGIGIFTDLNRQPAVECM